MNLDRIFMKCLNGQEYDENLKRSDFRSLENFLLYFYIREYKYLTNRLNGIKDIDEKMQIMVRMLDVQSDMIKTLQRIGVTTNYMISEVYRIPLKYINKCSTMRCESCCETPCYMEDESWMKYHPNPSIIAKG